MLGREVWFSDTYNFILEFVSTKDEDGVYARCRDSEFGLTNNTGEDVFGNIINTFFSSAEGVDEQTWLFLQGAWYTNLSSNA